LREKVDSDQKRQAMSKPVTVNKRKCCWMRLFINNANKLLCQDVFALFLVMSIHKLCLITKNSAKYLLRVESPAKKRTRGTRNVYKTLRLNSLASRKFNPI